MKLPGVVYIRWRDACLPEDNATPTLLSDACKTLELHAVGWILHETDEAITLGVEYDAQDDNYARAWQTIPKVNIQEIRRFRLPRRRPKS